MSRLFKVLQQHGNPNTFYGWAARQVAGLYEEAQADLRCDIERELMGKVGPTLNRLVLKTKLGTKHCDLPI